MHFSVLMSLYIKEHASYFEECLLSVLSQTVTPDEIVIVLDGPISNEVNMVLEKYISKDPEKFIIIPLEKNQGLGISLAKGVLACSNELIARMDTDDVAVRNRFELQLKEFEKNPNLDICGSSIIEFEGNINHIVAKRKVPLTDSDIKKYQKRRDSFNHMTVMFKKSSVLKAGNYQPCPLMEDSLLWAHMIQSGAVCMNIEQPLVYARIGKDMFERRGGLSYFQKYKAGRKKILKTGFLSKKDYYITLIIQFIVCILPNRIRGFVFKKILHN